MVDPEIQTAPSQCEVNTNEQKNDIRSSEIDSYSFLWRKFHILQNSILREYSIFKSFYSIDIPSLESVCLPKDVYGKDPFGDIRIKTISSRFVWIVSNRCFSHFR